MKQNEKKTTSLSNTVLWVVKQVEINEKNEKNMASSSIISTLAMATQQEQVMQGICIN